LVDNKSISKPNGDFMITSSAVLQDMHPTATMAEITEMLIAIGDEYEAKGYQLSYTFDEELS